jgi:hypothetical protein
MTSFVTKPTLVACLTSALGSATAAEQAALCAALNCSPAAVSQAPGSGTVNPTAAPAAGASPFYVNTATNTLWVYTGGSWHGVSGSAGGALPTASDTVAGIAALNLGNAAGDVTNATDALTAAGLLALVNQAGGTNALQTAIKALGGPAPTLNFTLVGTGNAAVLRVGSGTQTADVTVTDLCNALSAAGCVLGSGGLASVVSNNTLSGAGTTASPLEVNVANVCAALTTAGCSTANGVSVSGAFMSGNGTAANPITLDLGVLCAALASAGCTLTGSGASSLFPTKSVPASGPGATTAFAVLASMTLPGGGCQIYSIPPAPGGLQLVDSNGTVFSPGPFSAIACSLGAGDLSSYVSAIYN